MSINLLFLLAYFISVFSYLFPICCFLPFKLLSRQKFVLFIIIFSNLLLIGYVLGNIGVVSLLVALCFYVSFINVNHLRNICIIIASYLFCVICDNVYSLLWDSFIYPINQLQADTAYYLIYLISFCIVIACICPFIKKLAQRFFRQFQAHLPKPLIFLIMINLGICLFIFVFNIVMGERIGYTRNTVIFNCILFACYFLISTVFIITIIKTHMEKLAMDMRQESYQQLQEYTNQIENMYQSLRAFKHDYSNIMLSMSGYIDHDDFNGLKEYFYNEILPAARNLSKNTAHFNQLININSPELKSIISAKLLYAMELNIQIHIEVAEAVTALSIDSLDLCRITGIFLDNAIEATIETENPLINFAIINMETKYIFIISNTFVDNGMPFATLSKPDVSTKGKNRGLGLHNAHQILSKYKDVLLDTEIQSNIFIQRLYIPHKTT